MTSEPLRDVATLAAMQVSARLDRLRALLGGAGCDALVVTNLVNIRYLTGFTGSAATLVVDGDGALLVTDGRYGDQAPSQLAAAGVDARVEITSSEQSKVLAGALSGSPRVGLEAPSITWAQARSFEAMSGVDLVATDGLVESLRLTKDPGELDRMRAAAAIADEALRQVRLLLGEGPAEREFAAELDARIRHLGATGNSFETIVASGPNSALPHARPTGRRIVDGDLVVIDFGAVVDGYCSDMTRTVCVGEPSREQRHLFEVVSEAQRAGVERVADGVAAADIDAACREVIQAAGWAERFTHGTGHGVGLDIHEAPRVGASSTATIGTGQVVTVEPGVYLVDRGEGVRIEDTLVVTAEGRDPLTLTTKSMAIA